MMTSLSMLSWLPQSVGFWIFVVDGDDVVLATLSDLIVFGSRSAEWHLCLRGAWVKGKRSASWEVHVRNPHF